MQRDRRLDINWSGTARQSPCRRTPSLFRCCPHLPELSPLGPYAYPRPRSLRHILSLLVKTEHAMHVYLTRRLVATWLSKRLSAKLYARDTRTAQICISCFQSLLSYICFASSAFIYRQYPYHLLLRSERVEIPSRPHSDTCFGVVAPYLHSSHAVDTLVPME